MGLDMYEWYLGIWHKGLLDNMEYEYVVGVEYNNTTKVEQSLWLKYNTIYSNNPTEIWIYVG
jgi:hypothetical protein